MAPSSRLYCVCRWRCVNSVICGDRLGPAGAGNPAQKNPQPVHKRARRLRARPDRPATAGDGCSGRQRAPWEPDDFSSPPRADHSDRAPAQRAADVDLHPARRPTRRRARPSRSPPSVRPPPAPGGHSRPAVGPHRRRRKRLRQRARPGWPTSASRRDRRRRGRRRVIVAGAHGDRGGAVFGAVEHPAAAGATSRSSSSTTPPAPPCDHDHAPDPASVRTMVTLTGSTPPLASTW